MCRAATRGHSVPRNPHQPTLGIRPFSMLKKEKELTENKALWCRKYMRVYHTLWSVILFLNHVEGIELDIELVEPMVPSLSCDCWSGPAVSLYAGVTIGRHRVTAHHRILSSMLFKSWIQKYIQNPSGLFTIEEKSRKNGCHEPNPYLQKPLRVPKCVWTLQTHWSLHFLKLRISLLWYSDHREVI